MTSTSNLSGYQLSPHQERLYRLGRNDTISAFRAQCTVQLRGAFSRSRLEAALHTVVRRHEILRTSFHRVPGVSFPVQVIADSISGSSLSIQFDSTPDQAQFHLALPSLCSDTITLQSLVREIAAAYTEADGFSDDPIQYADASELLREWIEGPEAEAAKRYWAQIPIADEYFKKLPLAHHRGPEEYAGLGCCSATLPIETQRSLEALAEKWSSSLDSLLLACWYATLQRWSGSREITVACRFDGRPQGLLDNAVGLYANFLPVTASVKLEEQLSVLVHELNKVRAEHGKWQMSYSHAETTPSLCAFEVDYPGICFKSENTEFVLSKLHAVIDHFGLWIHCSLQQSHSNLELFYDRRLCSESQAGAILNSYLELVRSVARKPKAIIGELELVGAEERELLLRTWNTTKVDFTQSTVVELFEHQVALRPHALAVRDTSGNCLTYAQLNAAANRWARRLRHAGIGPEARVGVCLQRSCSLIVALLGVLKSGAAYVPLDPSYPQDRLAFMIQDADLALLLTQASLASALPDSLSPSLPILRTEEEHANDGTELENQSSSDTSNLPLVAQPDNLAYVIYTSGSTGRPKGVMISHRGLSNYVAWATQFYAVTEGAGALLHSPLSFDLTVTSLFVPLAGGSTVVVVEQNQ
ncbi:MAG TPA: AMP-binding protein, partial [Candidatus Angelobacter sp.]|nr:AMP-binding protein [Candidatus Angelobacter sp.]